MYEQLRRQPDPGFVGSSSELRSEMMRRLDPRATAWRIAHDGWDRRVTAKTYEQYLNTWNNKRQQSNYKPAWPKKDSDFDNIGPLGPKRRELTMASFLLLPKFVRSTEDKFDKSFETKDITELMNFTDTPLTDEILATGKANAGMLALTKRAIWVNLCTSMKIWVFSDKAYHLEGPRGVFFALNPECTKGDVHRAARSGEKPPSFDHPAVAWWEEAHQDEWDLRRNIQVHRTMYENALADGQSRVDAIRPAFPILGRLAAIWLMSTPIEYEFCDKGQIRSRRHLEQLFEPLKFFSGKRLQALVHELHNQRNSIKVLYLEKIPLLDRRMLAIILRDLPKIVMIGIYDCELIDFSDIICILDLIGEINHKRREQGLATIEALDFGPKFVSGEAYKSDRSGTYGFLWTSSPLEVVQRGFYAILLKAFMKAHSLGLNILFEEGSALREFCLKVPTLPFGVPTFLDALHRTLDLDDVEDIDQKRKKRKAIYDLRVPVRMGLEDFDRTDRRYNQEERFFCSFCGYEMLLDFFCTFTRTLDKHEWVCCGCALQSLMVSDQGRHHLLRQKSSCLNRLMVNSVSASFNFEVPIPERGQSVISLFTTLSESPPHVIGEPRTLVRNLAGQTHGLAKLPSLEYLASDDSAGEWGHFWTELKHLDALSLIQRTFISYISRPAPTLPFNAAELQRLRDTFPMGRADHVAATQPTRVVIPAGGRKHCYDPDTALWKHLELVDEGFMPGGAAEHVVSKEDFEAFKNAWAQNFW